MCGESIERSEIYKGKNGELHRCKDERINRTQNRGMKVEKGCGLWLSRVEYKNIPKGRRMKWKKNEDLYK